MNPEEQKKIDEQIEKGNTPTTQSRIVEMADAPLLPPDVLERDKREFDLVEVNFKDQSAKVVETSKAPKLTPKFLKEKGKPIKSVESFFDFGKYTVYVKDGASVAVDIGRRKIVNSFADRLKALQDAGEKTTSKKYKTLLQEREEAAKRYLISVMIDAPKFSYGGGEGTPLEEQSQLLINALWDAYVTVNFPLEDQIYQVKVLRSVPIETSILFQQGFEIYPLGNLGKPIDNLSGAEIRELDETNLAQRRLAVSSMVLNYTKKEPKPIFSYNGEGVKNAFPVEDISETFLQTLFAAYRIVNVPSAQLSHLQRFPELGRESGEDSGSEPLDRD